jgi:hypothetical protein
VNLEAENGSENLMPEAIEAVKDIRDPLNGLAERVAADPGVAFTPEVLERLATVKSRDRPTFELLRSNLKKYGCRVAALGQAIAEEGGDAGRRGPSQANSDRPRRYGRTVP